MYSVLEVFILNDTNNTRSIIIIIIIIYLSRVQKNNNNNLESLDLNRDFFHAFYVNVYSYVYTAVLNT